MDYERFVQEVQKLDFIRDRETADAAVKAVLGTLASRMNEMDARKLTDRLPEPLKYENLRSHQRRDLGISPDQQVGVIQAQFRLKEEQARILVDTVLRCTRDMIGEDLFFELSEHMPSEWAETIQRA